MNPWHYASRQSYNTFKGNSFQKDAVEDKPRGFAVPCLILVIRVAELGVVGFRGGGSLFKTIHLSTTACTTVVGLVGWIYTA
jgi:hypothetical protein